MDPSSLSSTQSPPSAYQAETTPSSSSSSDNPVMHIDFSWSKFKARITEGTSDETKYIVNHNIFKNPMLKFYTGDNSKNADSQLVGTGSIHPISIHCKYELRGRKGKLKALKRFLTQPTHLSYNYSDSKDGTPALMTWRSAANWKTWDFMCLDEQGTAVAKFSARCWAINKVADVEFMGPKAHDIKAREEIMIIGLTLFNCMMLRVNNIFNFFGACVARTGPLDKETAEKGEAWSSEDEKHRIDHKEDAYQDNFPTEKQGFPSEKQTAMA